MGHIGIRNSRLYNIWTNMRSRCNYKGANGYNNYGGRGIKVCEDWDSFESFHKWSISSGYSDDLSLDRIDNDGNYEPRNCRWATNSQQANNARSNIRTSIDGIERTLAQHGDFYSFSKSLIRYRYHRGLRDIDLIKPSRVVTPIIIDIEGVKRNIQQHADFYDVGYDAVIKRYHKGVRGIDLVKPSRKKRVRQ